MDQFYEGVDIVKENMPESKDNEWVGVQGRQISSRVFGWAIKRKVPSVKEVFLGRTSGISITVFATGLIQPQNVNWIL